MSDSLGNTLTIQFNEELENAYANIRTSLINAFGEETLIRFLIPPYWTSETLTAIVDPEEQKDLMSRAHFLGLGTIEMEGMRICIDTTGRDETIRLLGGESIRLQAANHIQDTAQKILDIIESSKTPTGIPEILTDWANLAHQDLNEILADLRREESDSLQLEKFISAASPIAELMQGECAAAVGQLKRKQLRKVIDVRERRALESFLPRTVQIDAIITLLSPNSSEWALHVIGQGGFGKTMLVRHVVAELAPQYGFAVGRIDFDLLSPDFPVIEPGQLLLALARDLQERYGQIDTANSFNQVIQESASTREISGLENIDIEPRERSDVAKDPLGFINSDQFLRQLYAFQDFIVGLQRPVLLVLDTCEELARLRLGAEKLPQVEATLEILERVQAGFSGLRVLFAGRRYLAQGGSGWEANTPDRKSLPAARSYLRLHQVEAFDETEAIHYLFEKRHLEKRGIGRDSAVCKRLLEICRDPESKDYNPFDLNLYTSWVTDDPDAASQILDRKDVDPYVNTRILGRIDDPDVKKAVYALIVLGQASKELIVKSLKLSEYRSRIVEAELVSLEWVDTGADGDSLIISPRLATRLDRYFSSDMTRERSEVQRRIRSYLKNQIVSKSFKDVHMLTIGAAAKLLDPKIFAELWDRTGDQFTKEGNQQGLLNIASFLLGEEGRSPLIGSEHPCRAGVLADFATSIDKTSPQYESVWTEVQNLSSAYPTDKSQSIYRTSINALMIVKKQHSMPHQSDLLEEILVEGDDRLTSSQLNLVEDFLDRRSRIGRLSSGVLKTIHSWHSRILEQHPLYLPSSICFMQALVLAGKFEAAQEHADRILARLNESGEISSFGQWTAPQDFRSFALLRMAMVIPGFLDKNRHLQELHLAIDRRTASIEADRLASLWLAWTSNRARYGSVFTANLSDIPIRTEGKVPKDARLCSLVPPFFAALGQDICRHQNIEKALSYLDSLERQLDHSQTDRRMVVTALQFELIGRSRSIEFERILYQNLSRRLNQSCKNLRWLSILSGTPIVSKKLSTDSWHETFSTEFSPIPSIYRIHLQESMRIKRIQTASTLRHCELDMFEMDLLDEKLGEVARPRPWDPQKYVERYIYRAEEAANVVWRRYGLVVADDDLNYWQSLIGHVRFAEIGCEEALLVARRLPKVAHRILNQVFALLGDVDQYPSVLRMLGKNANKNPARFLKDLERADTPYDAMRVLGYDVADSALKPPIPNEPNIEGDDQKPEPITEISIDGPFLAGVTSAWDATISLGSQSHQKMIPGVVNIHPRDVHPESSFRRDLSKVLLEQEDADEGFPILANAFLSSWPWEVILPGLLNQEPKPKRPRFVRKVKNSSLPDPFRVYGKDESFVSQQWAQEISMAMGNTPGTQFAGVSPTSLPHFADSYRILHLVGRGDQSFKEFRLIFPEASATLSESGYSQRTALFSRDIPAPRCGLIIIQGEPSLESRRGNSTLIDTATLRGFSAELCAYGARFVLMIPSMPKIASLRIVKIISDRFENSTENFSRAGILDLIQDMKERITDPDWTQEALPEITLFVNDNLIE
jgi:hypothetical protein